MDHCLLASRIHIWSSCTCLWNRSVFYWFVATAFQAATTSIRPCVWSHHPLSLTYAPIQSRTWHLVVERNPKIYLRICRSNVNNKRIQGVSLHYALFIYNFILPAIGECKPIPLKLENALVLESILADFRTVLNSTINAIAAILLYVFRNPVFSNCAPKHPIKLVNVIIPPSTSNAMDVVLLVVELIKYAPFSSRLFGQYKLALI